MIVVDYKEWSSGGLKADVCLELKIREVHSLIRTKGCRRRAIGQYLDNDTRRCNGVDAGLRDNCQLQDPSPEE